MRLCNEELDFRGKLTFCGLERDHSGPHDFDFFFEEGDSDDILSPEDEEEHHNYVKAVADEHGFPLSDWKPTLNQDELIAIAPELPTKEKGLCENCGERDGKWHWLGESDGSLAISHGWVQSYPWWCEVCCLKGKIAYAVEQAAKIPEYEKELAEILDGEV